MSYVDKLICPKCNATYNPVQKHNLCDCGSPLLVQYNLKKARKELNKNELSKSNDIWKYKKLLPIKSKSNVISLGEGDTPLFKLDNLGEKLNCNNLYMKDESFNPTGTFKARGAASGISKIKELGIKKICMPTAGNAGSAWSAFSAKAKVEINIVMPKDAPEITKIECASAGANVYLIDGLISDAGELISEGAQKYGWFEVATLKEPYRIEGKKTMGYEIIEQLNWRVPDAILYPCGGGVGIIGIWKAIKEMRALGWISKNKLPKMIAVQSEGCAPIVNAYKNGETNADFWRDAETIAGGIRVPEALGDFLVLEAIYDSKGAAVAVSDEEIKNAMQQMTINEGFLICPEGAATIAAIPRLIQDSIISNDDQIVILNTGSGLKYSNLIDVNLPFVESSKDFF